MSKAVLISVKPEWCKLIVDGEKTVEVRKSRPKLEVPFKCYIYCTYGEGLIERYDQVYPNMLVGQSVTRKKTWGNCCNGKVIGEFVCNAVSMNLVGYKGDVAGYHDLLNGSCLSGDDLMEYGNWKILYGWHISNLVIYDTPKPLSVFYKECAGLDNTGLCWDCEKASGEECDCAVNGQLRLARPPQSWCYVEEVGAK